MARVGAQQPSTEWLLEEWARWSQEGSNLGYPNATPFRRLLGSTVATPLIDDDKAMLIGDAVAKLKVRHPEMWRAVTLYYLKRMKVSEVAQVMGVYHGKADVLIKSGVAWVDATLEMLANYSHSGG